MAVRTTSHSMERVKQAYAVVNGTIAELQAAAEGAHRSLATNARMYAATKDTGAKSPSKANAPARKLNPTEMEELKARLRDQLWASGDERFPTEYEIEEEVKKVQEREKLTAQSAGRRQGVANKPIVEALEKLRDSSARCAADLEPYRDALTKQMQLLDEIYKMLESHRKLRDDLFDPVLSNPAIENSVLYQKINPMKPLTVDLDDKDQESTSGRLASPFGNKMTGHEATFEAAKREDLARNACTRALKAVRDARSELNVRKSALQVSVRTSREVVLKQRRAAKSGNFGSSEERNTDPATRKTATNPEDS